MLDYLDFEQPIVELEAKIEELRRLSGGSSDRADIGSEIRRLEKKCSQLRVSVYSSLTAWQVAQMARHPQRPYTLDYVKELFSDFEELHGDRQYADDRAIVAGVARFKEKPVAVVGHQKGRTTEEKVLRNFGMACPEGYRKAQRIFRLAEKFNMPLLTFIDTPGAYPGIGAEERNQSYAIASNLKTLSCLGTPIISTVIGEGGSGGALAVGVGDCLLMLQYSTYSVISPEGCASILWKDAGKADLAADALCITAEALRRHGLVDEVIAEPPGGAHRDFPALCKALGQTLDTELNRLGQLERSSLVDRRRKRLVNISSVPLWQST